MRTKVTLVLIFLNVALFFVIFHFERTWRTDSVAREVRRRVLGAETTDIRSFEVKSVVPNGSFSVERKGGEWFLTKPVQWRANANAVARILSDLEFMEHFTSFDVAAVVKNGQSLADYGLATPKITVTFNSGGVDTNGRGAVSTTIGIGEMTKVGQRLYVLSPDKKRIHVVGREIADSLSMSLEQLRSDTVLTIPVYEARAINIQAAPPTGVHVVLQNDGSKWSFETPIPARANKDAVELAINGLDGLRVKSFVPDTVQVTSDARFRLTIEGNNRYETLFIGAEVPSSLEHKVPVNGHEFYAQIEDSNKASGRSGWFTLDVPDALMTTLRDAQESLRDRHLLDFDPTLVSVISLKAPNQPTLTLQRLEADAATGEVRWQIVTSGDASQGPLTLAADTKVVQHFLDSLVLLSARQFKSDAPQASDLDNWGFNRPERTILINQQLNAGSNNKLQPANAQLALEIGRSTDRNDPYVYAHLVNALSVYSIDPDLIRDTDVNINNWRNKQLSNLPAAAQVVSVELIDLKDNHSMGKWISARDNQSFAGPLNSKIEALRQLAGQLKNLRASRFVQSSFSTSANTQAGLKPWRYRLDEQIALPGSNGKVEVTTHSLWLSERSGGTEQIAGSSELGLEFSIEQSFIDQLWTLTYGASDPGVPQLKN
jgi:hypothetical protein